MRTEQLHEVFVDLPREHHLDDIHCLLIRIAQAADKAALFAKAVEHSVNLRAAAMDEHHMDTHQ